MPTEHKKKKSKKEEKSEKKPLLLSIKSEPDDLKPLEHYVDDRIELIRQIFSTLKSKTIQSIIPEFLQEKSTEEIEEICLEELLGISEKRLLSIINATKCPSDTESSDSGSDVEKIEEHISLEEISSDSNDDMSKQKRKKKRTANQKDVPKPVQVKGPIPSTATTTATASAKDENGKPEEKQYSVLELLELQARARAIRSQLALEPVTKIELDDSDEEAAKEPKSLEKVSNSTIRNEETQSKSNIKDVNEPKNSLEAEPTQSSTKPQRVKLKRNFRQRQTELEEGDGEEQNQENDPSSAPDEPEKLESKEVDTPEKSIEEEKSKSQPKAATENLSASQNDDDIIPIIAEPEILCISSSDSESEEKKVEKKAKKSYITMPAIEKEVREPTEDELFLQKIKEKSDEARLKTTMVNTSTNESLGTETTSENTAAVSDSATKQQSNNGESTNESTNSKLVEEQLEDGEILDDEILEINESSEESMSGSKTNEPKEVDGNRSRESSRSNSRASSNSPSRSSTSESGHNEISNDEKKENNAEKSNEGSNLEEGQTEEKKSNIEDDDEDIIDLGNDSDFEIKNVCDEPEVDEPRKTRSAKRKNSKEKRSDEPKDESWDKRWLRGEKVTKVLATAKLANKVRSKIKEKKTKKTEKPVEKAKTPEPEEKAPEIPSTIEVGSVEHYKELTKQK